MSNNIFKGLVSRSSMVYAAVLILIVILKTFFFDYYKVPSNSMLPAFKDGDFIIINKSAACLENCGMLKSISSLKVRKGDVWVFNKPMWESEEKSKQSGSFKGLEYVKRCAGCPGDTVNINKPDMELLTSGYASRKEKVHSLKIFPHDSTYAWSINQFGPLWIPKKGAIISLNLNTVKLYRSIIRHEGGNIVIKNDIFYVNNRKAATYKFKNNYYFMLGDNFYDSEDSRIWGLVPEDNLIGNVILVL